MTSVIAHPPSPTRSPRSRPSPREGENHTNEITPACLASSQAEKVIVVSPLSEMSDKSLDECGVAHSVSTGRYAEKPGATFGEGCPAECRGAGRSGPGNLPPFTV